MSLTGSAALESSGTGSSSQGLTLAPPFEPTSLSTHQTGTSSTIADADDKKKKRRSLFGFGKKKPEDAPGSAGSARTTTTPTAAAPENPASNPTLSKSPSSPPTSNRNTASASVSPQRAVKDTAFWKPTSPIQTDSASMMSASITSSGFGGSGTAGGSNFGSYYVMPPASPGRSITALSSSPRISSPAGSQIFERDVQESSIMVPNSPAIPSHITTENYIPPVLDASSEAITDDHLDPDTVEIITHTLHQPAVVAVAAGGSGVAGTGDWVDDVASNFVAEKDDSASNYGSFDMTDVRRLSFISFADVVQAEQQQQQHQALASSGSLAGLANLSLAGSNVNRSSSPMRSPTAATATTDRFGTSPPTSKSGSIKGIDVSPSRKPIGPPARSPMLSPIGVGAPISSSGSAILVGGGEISIETMSQALRRTGSGDLNAMRSTPQSPI